MLRRFDLNSLSFEETQFFNRIRSILGKDRFLVGGLIRDSLLGLSRRKVDFDIVSPRPEQDVSLLQKSLGGTVVVLDSDLGMYRLVIDPSKYIDLVRLRGENLEQDLRHRDFTVNAIAVSLEDLKIVDPLRGQRDIRLRKLRLCGEKVLLEDPLRVLRAFSISSQCSLTWAKDVESGVMLAKEGLRWVARERINQELLRLFSSPASSVWARKMYELGVFSILVPEMDAMEGVWQGHYHHLDVLNHSFLALERLEELLKRLPRITRIKNRAYLLRYLEEPIGNWPRYALLKWAELFHDVGKPFVREVKEDGKITFYRHDLVGSRILTSRMKELKFSRRQIEFVRTMIRLHMRPGDLTKEGVSAKAVYRFFRQAGGEDLAVMLLSWADAWATRGRLNPWRNFYLHRKRLIDMINLSIEEKTRPQLPRLLTGNDVMQILSIPPGPAVGQALETIREKQFLGEIRTREEAEEALKIWWEEKKILDTQA